MLINYFHLTLCLDMREFSIRKGYQQTLSENPSGLLFVILGDGSSVHV